MQIHLRLGKHRSTVTPVRDRDSHARSETPPIHHSFLYIAMAHTGLATAMLVLYGLYLLLADFLRLLQWALLCSVPLRETQRVNVAFWAPHCSRCRSPRSSPRSPRSPTCAPRSRTARSQTRQRSHVSLAGSSPSSSFSSSSSSSTRVAVDFLNASSSGLSERAKKARELTEAVHENFRQLGPHFGK